MVRNEFEKPGLRVPRFISSLKKKYLLPWQSWVFAATRGLSLVAAVGGHRLVAVRRLLIAMFLFLRSTGSRAHGLQKLWLMDSVAVWHVGSPRTRDQTHVP